MSEKEISYGLAEMAVEEGIKIRHNTWPSNRFITYSHSSGDWFSDTGIVQGNPDFTDIYLWEVYTGSSETSVGSGESTSLKCTSCDSTIEIFGAV